MYHPEVVTATYNVENKSRTEIHFTTRWCW